MPTGIQIHESTGAPLKRRWDEFRDLEINLEGVIVPNHGMQRTANRAAADADVVRPLDCPFSVGFHDFFQQLNFGG